MIPNTLPRAPLDGRVAVVTGAGRNTGRAIALELASLGCDVAVLVRQDRSSANRVCREIRKWGRRAVPVVADLIDPPQIAAGIQEARDSLGPIAVLVCNVGYRSHAPFLQITPEEWRMSMAINLDGAFYCMQSVLADMVELSFGRIIAITGTAGHRWPNPFGNAHVAAAKSGVEGLIRTLAREYARCGITANAIAPGPIDTRGDVTSRPDERPDLAAGRKAKMEEVAYLVGALCREAAQMVNGEVILVDGGGPIAPKAPDVT